MNGHGPVVCAYDGSDDAQRALDWAAAEALRRETDLRIVTALNWPVGADPVGAPATYLPTDRRTEEKARSLLDDAAQRISAQDPAPAVASRLERGAIVTALLDEATSASVLVLGARGLGGFRGLLLGSVSTAVAEMAPCPVVVVRPGAPPGAPPGPYAGQVVVGVDGSTAAENAVGFAVEEAAARGVDVVAVAAVQPDSFAQSLGVGAVEGAPALEGAVRASVERTLAPWREKFPEVAIRDVIDVGHPVQVLCSAGADAALLVVGSRGRSGLEGALLGSVSRGVLHHATGPVAVVRAAR